MFDLTLEQEIEVMLKAMAKELGIGWYGYLEWHSIPYTPGHCLVNVSNRVGEIIIKSCGKDLESKRDALNRWFDMNEATPF
jgi:hypothetical protein